MCYYFHPGISPFSLPLSLSPCLCVLPSILPPSQFFSDIYSLSSQGHMHLLTCLPSFPLLGLSPQTLVLTFSSPSWFCFQASLVYESGFSRNRTNEWMNEWINKWTSLGWKRPLYHQEYDSFKAFKRVASLSWFFSLYCKKKKNGTNIFWVATMWRVTLKDGKPLS